MARSLISCLQSNTALFKDLKDLVTDAVLEMAGNGESIEFQNLYKRLIGDEMNLDIDMQTAAALYENSRNEISRMVGGLEASMTPTDILDEWMGAKVKKDAEGWGNASKTSFESLQKQMLNSANNVANALFNMINSRLWPVTRMASNARIIQDTIDKYAKSLLPAAQRKGLTPKQLLAKALDVHAMRATMTPDETSDEYVKAGSSTEALFNDLWPAIEEMSKQIDDPAIRARFLQEFDVLRKTAYKLAITQGNRKKIINDVLREAYPLKDENGKDKLNSSGSKIIDWHSIMTSGDPAQMLRDALEDTLKGMKLTGNLDLVYDALLDDFNDLRNMNNNTKIASDFKENRKRLVEEVAMSKGAVTTDGRVKLPDWKSKDSRFRQWLYERLLEDSNGNEAYARKESSQDDIKSVLEELVNKWAKDQNYTHIKYAVARMMAINNKPTVKKVNKLDRLVKFLDMGGFNEYTDIIASNILGSRISPGQIAAMRAIMEKRKLLLESSPEEMAAKAGVMFSGNSDLSVMDFANTLRAEMTNDVSALMRASVEELAEGRIANAVRGMNFISMQNRAALTALLSNIPNIIQNISSALSLVYKLFIKLPGTFVRGSNTMTRGELWTVFLSLLSADTPPSDNMLGLNPDSITPQNAKTDFEKKWVKIKILTEGLLTAIDGVAYIRVQQDEFYDLMKNHMRAAGVNPKIAKSILDDFSSKSIKAEAEAYARWALLEKGITPATPGYKRLLVRYTSEIQQGVWAQKSASTQVHPDYIREYFGLSKDLAAVQLGKKDNPQAMAGVNPFHAMASGMNRMRENAAQEFMERPDDPGTLANYIIKSWLQQVVNVGLTPWASGAYRWTMKSISGTGLGILYGGVTVGRNRAKIDRLLKPATGLTVQNPGAPPKNVQAVMNAAAKWRLDRYQMLLGTMGLASALATGMALFAFGDDDDEGLTRVANAGDKLRESGIVGRALMDRIFAPAIRIMQIVKDIKDKNASGHPAKVSEYIEAPIKFFNTRTPITINDFIELLIDKETGGFNFAQLGKAVGQATFPIIALASMPFNIINFSEAAIKGVDASGGDAKKMRIKSHPFLKLKNDFINGVLWGVTGSGVGLFFQDDRYTHKDLEMLDKSPELDVKELKKRLYGRSFDDIEWEKYGVLGLTEDNKEDIANIDAKEVYSELRQLSREIKIGPFKSKRFLDVVWENPILDEFNFKVTDREFEQINELCDGRLERNSSGFVSLLGIVKETAFRRQKEITATNIVYARKFQILQAQLREIKSK